MSVRRRLPSTSDSRPPPGRVTRFMKANDEAASPAAPAPRFQVSEKKVGSIDTTASSEPKVQK